MKPSDSSYNPFNMDWDQFQQSFKDQIPFNNQQLPWIQDYIQNILSQTMPGPLKGQAHSSRYRSEVFETHDYMIAKIKLPEGVNPDKLKVLLGNHILRLEGDSREESHTLTLPSPGRFHGSRAICKNGVLEVRIPKEDNDNFRQIHIRVL